MTDVRIDASVVQQTADSITLAYALENTTGEDVVLCNRLHHGLTPDGAYDVDADAVYVRFERGPRPVIGKWIPDRGEDVNVEHPVQPCGTVLAAGARFEEQITIALPLAPIDAYRPTARRDPSLAEPSTGLAVAIGWIPRSSLDDVLVPEVATTAGRLPIVKASVDVQRLARVDLDVSVSSLPPFPTFVYERTCTSCDSVNRGEQPQCLRCGTPLPPPAGPDWRATHAIAAGGADGRAPDGVVTRLEAGLPVQVVEVRGDVSRVLTWTGWTGWVYSTSLTPAG